jgi:hypothetical protein
MAAPASAPESTTPIPVTLLELISAIGDCTDDENEIVATALYMIERGSVRLVGNFAGCRSFRD